MKKKFESPVMEVIKIKKQNLLAGSPGKGGEYNSGESILSRELEDLDDFDF